jgi:hypothetical protein
MRRFIAVFVSFFIVVAGMPASMADVLTTEEIMATEQAQYNKQQVLEFVDSDAVQAELVAMGVDIDSARDRIASMTDAEISVLNAQMQDMPAGGVVGTIFTVLVVLVVLDLIGITDLFSFIDPI